MLKRTIILSCVLVGSAQAGDLKHEVCITQSVQQYDDGVQPLELMTKFIITECKGYLISSLYKTEEEASSSKLQELTSDEGLYHKYSHTIKKNILRTRVENKKRTTSTR